MTVQQDEVNAKLTKFFVEKPKEIIASLELLEDFEGLSVLRTELQELIKIGAADTDDPVGDIDNAFGLESAALCVVACAFVAGYDVKLEMPLKLPDQIDPYAV